MSGAGEGGRVVSGRDGGGADRLYRGIVIARAGRNASGIRWYARTGAGVTLRADTLRGIMALVRDALPRP